MDKMENGKDRKRSIRLTAIGVGIFIGGVLLGSLFGQSCHRTTVHYVTHRRSEFHSETIREVEKAAASTSDKSANSYQTTPLQPIPTMMTATVGRPEGTTTPKSSTQDQWEETEEVFDYYDPGPVDEEPVKRLDNPSPSRYWVSAPNDKLNWFGALQSCAGMNMELLSVESEKESHMVDLLIKRIVQEDYEDYHRPNPSDDFWTAGTNLWTSETSEFYWASTGKEISDTGFTNWHDGNPNHPEGQHCVEITKSIDSPTAGFYKWNDYGCHIKARYICEAPLLLV